MAGFLRPRCEMCGKYARWGWETEQWVWQCDCEV